MKNERETRKALLISGKKEFMEKGYTQASLRNICKNAGATTGALYFFFQDKEDLFAAIVEEPVKMLMEEMQQHFKEEKKLLEEHADTNPILMTNQGNDLEVVLKVVHFLYQNQDAFLLVLTKSQGSRFETILDQFVEIAEKHYRTLADCFSNALGKERVEDYMIHWIAHMQMDAFAHMLVHEKSEEAALRHIQTILRFLIDGWVGMFR